MFVCTLRQAEIPSYSSYDQDVLHWSPSLLGFLTLVWIRFGIKFFSWRKICSTEMYQIIFRRFLSINCAFHRVLAYYKPRRGDLPQKLRLCTSRLLMVIVMTQKTHGMTELKTQTVHALLYLFWQNLSGEVCPVWVCSCVHVSSCVLQLSCIRPTAQSVLPLNTPHSPLIFTPSNMGVFDA